ARLSNHGNSSVPEAVHLVQSTWFVFGGHEEDVGACFNKVGAAVIKSEANARFRPVPLDNGSQIAFGFFIAASKQDEVEVFREQIIQNADDEIESLLDVDARDHGQQRPIKMRRIQMDFL